MNAEVREGYRRAKAITAERAKSFFFASAALVGARKRAAYALYAACRRLDDLVDGGGTVNVEGLRAAQAAISSCYDARPTPREVPGLINHRQHADVEGRFHVTELAALRDSIERFEIPEQPFQDLVRGMEMDLTKSRYANFGELELYCYRAAGTVGLLMAPVLGCQDPQALTAAADLGIAMQLTNILRDVAEDFHIGRVYLPQDELMQFGLTEQDLRQAVVDERWVEFMRYQIARARRYYARGAQGVPALSGFGAQRTVKLMGDLYGRILNRIEAQAYDVYSQRASVPWASKLKVLGRVMFVPSRVFVPTTPLVALPNWRSAA